MRWVFALLTIAAHQVGSPAPAAGIRAPSAQVAQAPAPVRDSGRTSTAEKTASESLAIARRGLVISTVSIVLGIFTAGFMVFSWRQTYRPIVTARVVTHAQGNQGIFLNLVVENSGSRPARNIRLLVDAGQLEQAFDPELAENDRAEVRGCFEEKFVIPVLAGQASTSNYFGLLASDGSVNRRLNTWQWHARLPLEIRYETLRGRKLRNRVDLFLADNSGFASTSWGKGD